MMIIHASHILYNIAIPKRIEKSLSTTYFEGFFIFFGGMPYIYIHIQVYLYEKQASAWYGDGLKCSSSFETSGSNFYSRHLGQQYEILLNDLASCQHLEEIEFLGSMIFKKKGFNTSTSFNHWVNHWALSQVFHQIITVQWVQHHWVFSQRTCNAWRNNIVFPQHIAAKHVTKQVLEQPPR
jgi:hypothetical protein